MAREKKTRIIDQVAEELGRSQIVVVTDYRGLTAKQITVLRRQLGKADSEYQVAKNTLVKFATSKAGMENLNDLLSGPVALAYGYGDPTRTVKALAEHMKGGSVLKVKGALLGKRVLSRDQVTALATLPARDVLIAQLVGQMKAPLQRLHGVLNSPLQGLVGVLQARVNQMESGGKSADVSS